MDGGGKKMKLQKEVMINTYLLLVVSLKRSGELEKISFRKIALQVKQVILTTPL